MPANDPYPDRAVDSLPWPETVATTVAPWPEGATPVASTDGAPVAPSWPDPSPSLVAREVSWPEASPFVAGSHPVWPEVGATPDLPLEPTVPSPSMTPLEAEFRAPAPWPVPVPVEAKGGAASASEWPESGASFGPTAASWNLPATGLDYAHEGWSSGGVLAPEPGWSGGHESPFSDHFPEPVPPTEYAPHGHPKELVTYNPFG